MNDSPATSPSSKLRTERDRFVAFAFCASDILIELNERHEAVFAAGAVQALEEPKMQMRQFARVTMDTSRFAQVGLYEGTLTLADAVGA